MKLKHILSSAVIVSLALSCGKLEPTDYTDLNTTIIPASESDVEALVNGVYYPFQSSWWDGMFAANDRGIIWFTDASAGILYNTWGVQKACNQYNFTAATGDITRFYYSTNPYLSIKATCRDDGYVNDVNENTLLIDQIENLDFLSDTKKNSYIATVRCARGFLAYTLYDLFGGISVAPLEMLKEPLKSEPVARLSNAEMVSFIEEDLNFAAKYLPSPDAAEYGKFSSGFAKMLLARLYLHEAKADASYYEKVETVASEIINGGYGYDIMPSYPAMFDLGGQGKANKEIIFAVPTKTSDSNSWNDWQATICPSDFGYGDWKGTSGYASTWAAWDFFDSFEAADTRKTYLYGEYTDKTGTLHPRGASGVTNGAIPLKFGPVPNYSGSVEKQDIIVYRYADALLAMAEALFLKPSSNTSDKGNALTYLNKVHTRAGLPAFTLADFPDNATFKSKLALEYKHEFWCENGQVRSDLIRLGQYGGPENTELYPLPNEVIVDGAGVVVQNPGF